MHNEYLVKSQENILTLLKEGGVFVDIKSAFNQDVIKAKGYHVWRL